MIAHNKTWLENEWIHEQLREAYDEGCIDRDELNSVRKIYEIGFYTPEVLMAIGLFIVSVIIIVFSFALLVLFFPISGTIVTAGIESIFFGTATYFVLEWIVSKGHFRSGVDEALIWSSGLFLVAGVNFCFEVSPMVNAAVICGLALWFSLRFLESMAGVLAFLAALAMIIIVLNKMGQMARSIIPWVTILASIAMYLLVTNMGKWIRLRYYRKCFLLVEIASLISLYLAGNYFVAAELAKSYLKLDLLADALIPSGRIFWILTLLVPWIYLLIGILRKDPVITRVGLIVLAASIFTIRYYYHVFPLDIAMISGGTLLILAAYLLLRWLRVPRFGFHTSRRFRSRPGKKQQLESILIGQLLQSQQQPPNGTKSFGGGSGGGSGAEGRF